MKKHYLIVFVLAACKIGGESKKPDSDKPVIHERFDIYERYAYAECMNVNESKGIKRASSYFHIFKVKKAVCTAVATYAAHSLCRSYADCPSSSYEESSDAMDHELDEICKQHSSELRLEEDVCIARGIGAAIQMVAKFNYKPPPAH